MSTNEQNTGINDDKAAESPPASSPKVAPTAGSVTAPGVSNHVSATHTPGPWLTDRAIDYAQEQRRVLLRSKSADPRFSSTDIAAAYIAGHCATVPQLVEALKAAERELSISVKTDPQASIALVKARAALAASGAA